MRSTGHIDDKGRLTLPKAIRDALQIQPGQVFYVKRDGPAIILMPSENPFDALAHDAVRDLRAGRTVPLA